MQLGEAVEEDGFVTLPKLLHVRIACKDCAESISLGTKFETLASAYTNSNTAPNCDKPVYGESRYLKQT